MDYKYAWKVRKIQLIIINAIFLVIGIITAISDRSLMELFEIWIAGSWFVGTIVANFSKSGDRMSSLLTSFITGMFSGAFAATFGGNPLFVFVFMIMLFKFMFGMIAICAILCFEFVWYPISSILYFVRSRD